MAVFLQNKSTILQQNGCYVFLFDFHWSMNWSRDLVRLAADTYVRQKCFHDTLARYLWRVFPSLATFYCHILGLAPNTAPVASLRSTRGSGRGGGGGLHKAVQWRDDARQLEAATHQSAS